jgi:diguanylate cyclase (GGDEF)-like protein/PAS domain S-box-containing protein
MDVHGSDAVSLSVFRSLVEESLTGVYLIQNDRLVYGNRKLADMFGYTREEMLALPTVLDVIEPSQRGLVTEKLRQRIAGEVDAVEYQVRGVRSDGRLIDLDVRSVRTTHLGAPAVAGSMVDITERRKLEDALRNLSLTDDLTGLYNRRGFTTLAERHLALARRHQRALLLVFADIDGLKEINDTHGHAVGDQAVVDVAGILRSTFRSADIIARLGGDEFTVFPLEAGGESADTLLRRLHESLAAFNHRRLRPYTLSLSVGVGRFDAGRCQTVHQLLAEADREMYERKKGRP